LVLQRRERVALATLVVSFAQERSAMKTSRSFFRSWVVAGALLASAGLAQTSFAQGTIGPVFVIAMENHNWTQPGTQTSPGQIFGNAAAPYINSLVTPGNPNAQFVSYASHYINSGVGIHPSEPNYIWAEAGSNLGVLNDNLPYGTGGTNQNTTHHLASLMNNAGVSWKSYQEDIDTDAAGNVLPQSQWISPIGNHAGTYTTVANAYNGSTQFNYAPKHNPTIFFSDTNGGNDATPANPAAHFYAPMQQFQTDLNNGTYSRYNWITPNQFNDQHTALSAGFNYHGSLLTGDAAAIAQGDNFLSIIVPQIMASDAFQNQNGTIVIWNDETEGGDDPSRTCMEIVISKLAKGNAYNSMVQYSHSSDLKTMQELFNVADTSATGFLGDAANASDLADMFVTGALPNAGATTIPAPGSLALLALGAAGLVPRRRRR
jgi:uncharacterized protein (TIGR03382 family)